MKTEEYKSIEDFIRPLSSRARPRTRRSECCISSSPVRIFPPIWNVIGRYSDTSRVALLGFSETPELRLPVKESSDKRKMGWAIAVCVAASLLLFLVNTVFMNQNASFNPYEGSYIVRNGVVMTDIKKITTRIGGHIPSGGSDGEECGSALKKCG